MNRLQVSLLCLAIVLISFAIRHAFEQFSKAYDEAELPVCEVCNRNHETGDCAW